MKSKPLIILSLVLSIIAASSVMAKPFWGDRGAHMMKRFEHMLEHLDLNEEQSKKAKLILENLKDDLPSKGEANIVQVLMKANPEEAGYEELVEENANLLAERVKLKVVRLAKTKQALYEILDSEQKQELSKLIEKRMHKMRKRMHENHGE